MSKYPRIICKIHKQLTEALKTIKARREDLIDRALHRDGGSEVLFYTEMAERLGIKEAEAIALFHGMCSRDANGVYYDRQFFNLGRDLWVEHAIRNQLKYEDEDE